MSTSGWGYRVGGWSAVVAAVLRLSIAAAFALTGLGAAGDRSYGSFSGLTFIPSAVLVVGVIGLYGAFAGRLARAGRLGIVVAGLGVTLVAIGQFGGNWLGFQRSGNLLIGPGAPLLMVGFIAFGVSARNTAIPRFYSTLALLIALLPVVFFPLAAGIEAVLGHGFPPSLHDNYFRVLNALGSLLWLALGAALLRESRGTPRTATA